MERLGKIRDRSIGAPELLQNAAPGSVRECGKRSVELAAHILNHTVQYASYQSANATGAQRAPVLHDDFTIVTEASGDLRRYAGIRAEVLVLSGTKSPRYLRAAAERLGQIIPGSRRAILEGVDHYAPLNRADRGHPEVVAKEVLAFFA